MLRENHLLNERYQIKTKIGSGGMADVYLARDIILDRDVAIKQLRVEYANDPEFIARFDREAQSATSLSHPNIVNIYDVGEEDHILYMVMEYVDGMTLKEYIHRHGPLDVEEAIDIMKQITNAIAHAHANDIVHRDIKPQNILMDKFGTVKVTDFGIAVALSATALTQTNSILGSVHYLSPEQARGGMATKKSDIYSLGIVLFELLTGRLPFSGQSPVSIALKHLQSETPSVRRFYPEVPQSVENIVLKATAKDPFHRYNSIYDLEDALDVALNPDKRNEPPYKPPVEVGEETKAIPIITDGDYDGNFDEQTIVHQTNGKTLNYDEQVAEKKAKSVPSKTKKKKVKNKDKKKRKKWPIIVTTLLALLISVLIALFVLPGIFQPKEVVLPDVSELEVEEATQLLEELDLQVEEEQEFSDELEEGIVIRTDPKAGRTVKTGSTVTLFVSKGKEKVIFADYEGQDFSQVKRLLEREGFSDIKTYEVHSDMPIGVIVQQIQPVPGSEVVPSETSVIFEVSRGPEQISLNNLTGMSLEDARSYLERNSLRINVIEEPSNNVPKGTVIRQSPSTGTEVEKGSTVDVYVSQGPQEKPPASHTISYTVPYISKGNVEDEEKLEEQVVKIYIDDMNNEITNVYHEEAITEDTEFTFTLTIAPGSNAEYIITRDDEVITSNSVSYKDGE